MAPRMKLTDRRHGQTIRGFFSCQNQRFRFAYGGANWALWGSQNISSKYLDIGTRHLVVKINLNSKNNISIWTSLNKDGLGLIPPMTKYLTLPTEIQGGGSGSTKKSVISTFILANPNFTTESECSNAMFRLWVRYETVKQNIPRRVFVLCFWNLL